jgi:hypothetical protein
MGAGVVNTATVEENDGKVDGSEIGVTAAGLGVRAVR